MWCRPSPPPANSSPNSSGNRLTPGCGLRAAEGDKGGRRPTVTGQTIADVHAAHLDGQTVAGLAREHGVSRGAIRTAVADLLPEHIAAHRDSPAPELPVTLDMPGKAAGFLRGTEPDDAERAALDHGVTVQRGRGRTLRVSVTPAVQRELLACRLPPSTAPRQFRHSAGPAASTRAASAPWWPAPGPERTSEPQPRTSRRAARHLAVDTSRRH